MVPFVYDCDRHPTESSLCSFHAIFNSIHRKQYGAVSVKKLPNLILITLIQLSLQHIHKKKYNEYFCGSGSRFMYMISVIACASRLFVRMDIFSFFSSCALCTIHLVSLIFRSFCVAELWDFAVNEGFFKEITFFSYMKWPLIIKHKSNSNTTCFLRPTHADSYQKCRKELAMCIAIKFIFNSFPIRCSGNVSIWLGGTFRLLQIMFKYVRFVCCARANGLNRIKYQYSFNLSILN